MGGSLARCYSAGAHRRGPLPPRSQPRTRPAAVPAVTHRRWAALCESGGVILFAPDMISGTHQEDEGRSGAPT